MANGTRDPLARAFQLLRWLIGERLDSVGVRETALALSIAPSTAHSLLAALVAEGVLQHEERMGRYTLGVELFHLAHRAVDQFPFRRIAMPHLRKLVAASNEAAHLSLYVRERGALVTIAGVESTHPVRYVIDMYSWRPLHVGAAGWAVLAFLPPSERAEMLAQRPTLHRKMLDDAALAREMDRIATRGYAFTRGTRIEGAVGIAAPLFDVQGSVFGAVGVALPEQRFEPSEIDRLVKPLISCARDVMAEIEAPKPAPGRAAVARGKAGIARPTRVFSKHRNREGRRTNG